MEPSLNALVAVTTRCHGCGRRFDDQTRRELHYLRDHEAYQVLCPDCHHESSIVELGGRSASVSSGTGTLNLEVGVQVGSRLSNCLLGVFSLLLPYGIRQRFVAEALGDLAACGHWWQRVDHLVGLVLGTPRLAWMLWNDNGRGPT